LNLDQLINELASISSDPVIASLASLLATWKSDDSTADDLDRTVERFLGNVWVRKDEDHARAYALWSAFRNQNVSGIGGMTMNERLYAFSLFERFDPCVDEASRLMIYEKLNAEP